MKDNQNKLNKLKMNKAKKLKNYKIYQKHYILLMKKFKIKIHQLIINYHQK